MFALILQIKAQKYYVLLHKNNAQKYVYIVYCIVSYLEDKPHPEVGRCVERIGMSGPYGVLCCQGGKWPFSEVLSFCTSLLIPHFVL